MKWFFHVVIFAVLSVALCACASDKNDTHSTNPTIEMLETTEPIDSTLAALQFHVEYLETMKFDPVGATVVYCHHEDPQTEQIALEYACLVLEYEILRIEKLSSRLWVVEQFTKSEINKLGRYGVNYIGIIDGRYRVMANEEQIPQELKEGIEIPEYMPHGPGIVDEEDVLGTLD